VLTIKNDLVFKNKDSPHQDLVQSIVVNINMVADMALQTQSVSTGVTQSAPTNINTSGLHFFSRSLSAFSMLLLDFTLSNKAHLADHETGMFAVGPQSGGRWAAELSWERRAATQLEHSMRDGCT
jgi:hypothetical protein